MTFARVHIETLDEFRYSISRPMEVLTMLFVLFVPAILILLYIFFNPESFQYDTTLKQDF